MSDIRVESFDVDVSNLGTHTLANDVGAVANAFVKVNNNSRKNSAGLIGNTGNTAPNAACLSVELSATNQLTFRGATGANKFVGEVWRYEGAVGGANEFIVRLQTPITMAVGVNEARVAVAGVVDVDDVVPFLQGYSASGTSVSDWDASTIGVWFDTTTNEVVISRQSTTGSITAYVSVVEFTGSNWNIGLAVSSNHDSAREQVFVETPSGSAYDTGGWDKAFIEATAEGDTSETGLSDTMFLAYPAGASNTLWIDYQTADGGARNDGTAWAYVIGNTDLVVNRAVNNAVSEGDNTYGTPFTLPAGADQDAETSLQSLEWYVDTSGTGTAHVRGALAARIVGGDAGIPFNDGDPFEAVTHYDSSVVGRWEFLVTFAAIPEGVLVEAGGTGTGMFIGINDTGEFIARGGDGSQVTSDTVSRVVIPTSTYDFAGRTGRLVVIIDPVANTTRVTWDDGDTGSIDVDTTVTAVGSVPDWSGADGGFFGNSNGNLAGSEIATNFNFNGTITEAFFSQVGAEKVIQHWVHRQGNNVRAYYGVIELSGLTSAGETVTQETAVVPVDYAVITEQQTVVPATYSVIDNALDTVSSDYAVLEQQVTTLPSAYALPSAGGNCLAGWGLHKTITVAGSTDGAQTDYQMRVTVHKATGTDTATDIYLGTNVRDDFGDVRFTADDGNTELDYYLDQKIDGDKATFYVKVPSIPADPATVDIFIQYDNAAATTTSDGAATFEVFEDFEDTSFIFDISGAIGIVLDNVAAHSPKEGANVGVNNGTQGYKKELDSSRTYDDGYKVEVWAKILSGGATNEDLGAGISIFGATGGVNDGYEAMLDGRAAASPQIREAWDYGTRTEGTYQVATDTWYLLDIYVNGGVVTTDLFTEADAFADTPTATTTRADTTFTSGFAGISTYSANHTAWDGYRVRKYTPNEPTISAVGAETSCAGETVTQEQDTVPTDYAVVDQALDTIATEYAVIDQALDTVGSDYAVVDQATETIASDYAIADQAEDVTPAEYAIVDSAVDTVGTDYAVIEQQLTTLPTEYQLAGGEVETVPADYAVVTQTVTVLSSGYAIATVEGDTVATEYAIAVEVLDTIGTEYAVLDTAVETVPTEYAVSEGALETIGADYAVAAKVITVLTADYRFAVEGSELDTLPTEYAIVTDDQDVVAADYAVAAPELDTVSVEYAVQAPAAIDTLPVLYGVVTNALDTLAASYAVAEQVADTVTADYVVLVQSTIQEPAEYAIVTNSLLSVPTEFKVNQNAVEATPALYRVITSTVTTVDAEYFVLRPLVKRVIVLESGYALWDIETGCRLPIRPTPKPYQNAVDPYDPAAGGVEAAPSPYTPTAPQISKTCL